MGEGVAYQLYCHTNLVNGKMYFGITKNTWQDRWKTKYKHNLYFHRAIMKYSESDWHHEVIRDGMTRDQAVEWEKAYIDFFGTTDKERGYNRGRGGEGVNALDSLYAKQASREYHEALSDAMKNVWSRKSAEEIAELKERRSQQSKARWETPEYRAKMDEFYRRRREERENDPEYLAKKEASALRERERRRQYSKEHYRYTKVAPEIKHQHFSVAQKKVWERPGYREMMSEKARGRTLTEEQKEAIRRRLLGTTHTEERLTAIANGMKEKWQDPAFREAQRKKRKPRTDEQKEAMRSKQSAAVGRSILCVETGVIYPSIAAAARQVGKDTKRFTSAIQKQNTAYGYHWQILEPEKDRKREVICVETGARYDGLKDAERQTGVCASSICGVCQGRRKLAGGYHWCYAE